MLRTVLGILALCLCLPAAAEISPAWTERKCQLYRDLWTEAAAGGLDGIGPDFQAAHDDFLASGCQEGTVCPASKEELALADMLSLMAVSEGMTGSFLPFACAAPGAP